MRTDYDNLASVFPYVAAYSARRAELEAGGKYPYNDSFKGYIAAGLGGKAEDTAIYMLQRLAHLQADAARVNAAWDEGFRPLDRSELDETPRKVRAVVEFGWYMGGSGFRRSNAVRVLRLYGSVGIMAKGARTRGRIADGQVLVLR